MEDLYGIQTRRQAVEENIEKAFGSGVNLNDEVEKARSGVYADTAENRKLARVGQQYGSKKQPEQKNEKKVEKKNVNSDKLTRDEKAEITKMLNKFMRKEVRTGSFDSDAGKELISKLKEYGVEKVGSFMKWKTENTSSEGRSTWYYSAGEKVMGKDNWEKFLKNSWSSERHAEYMKTFKEEMKLEWDEPETKKERQILNRAVDAFKNFLEKNPDARLNEDEILALIDGSATEEEEFEHLTKLNGFDELNTAIENYVDKVDEDEDDN